MDRIEDLFSDKPPRTLHPAVIPAMSLARATMNRYYSKTDLSNVYRIAMGMLDL